MRKDTQKIIVTSRSKRLCCHATYDFTQRMANYLYCFNEFKRVTIGDRIRLQGIENDDVDLKTFDEGNWYDIILNIVLCSKIKIQSFPSS